LPRVLNETIPTTKVIDKRQGGDPVVWDPWEVLCKGGKTNSQRRGYSIKLSWFRKQGNAYSQNIKIPGMLK
jgi:hypothetical protein